MSSYIVGLTGGIACGKSNLSRALQQAGVQVIDADAVSRGLTAPGGKALPAIREIWGDQVFDGDILNRRALSDRVFSDPEEMKKLNGLMHPMILDAIRRALDAWPGPAVLEAPLLYETGIDAWCDEVWCAYVPQREQIRRLRHREGVTWREALRRIRSQMPAREKAQRSRHVIRTDGTKEDSGHIVLSLWRQLPAVQHEAEGEPT